MYPRPADLELVYHLLKMFQMRHKEEESQGLALKADSDVFLLIKM